ncbi:hypothetical protein JXA12_04165 [Candidatus Woesearchaeota archaeon]|nr:hypothetical protein [Candidatus Woesearchaeota archaeon]
MQARATPKEPTGDFFKPASGTPIGIRLGQDGIAHAHEPLARDIAYPQALQASHPFIAFGIAHVAQQELEKLKDIKHINDIQGLDPTNLEWHWAYERIDQGENEEHGRIAGRVINQTMVAEKGLDLTKPADIKRAIDDPALGVKHREVRLFLHSEKHAFDHQQSDKQGMFVFLRLPVNKQLQLRTEYNKKTYTQVIPARQEGVAEGYFTIAPDKVKVCVIAVPGPKGKRPKQPIDEPQLAIGVGTQEERIDALTKRVVMSGLKGCKEHIYTEGSVKLDKELLDIIAKDAGLIRNIYFLDRQHPSLGIANIANNFYAQKFAIAGVACFRAEHEGNVLKSGDIKEFAERQKAYVTLAEKTTMLAQLQKEKSFNTSMRFFPPPAQTHIKERLEKKYLGVNVARAMETGLRKEAEELGALLKQQLAKTKHDETPPEKPVGGDA